MACVSPFPKPPSPHAVEPDPAESNSSEPLLPRLSDQAALSHPSMVRLRSSSTRVHRLRLRTCQLHTMGREMSRQELSLSLLAPTAKAPMGSTMCKAISAMKIDASKTLAFLRPPPPPAHHRSGAAAAPPRAEGGKADGRLISFLSQDTTVEEQGLGCQPLDLDKLQSHRSASMPSSASPAKSISCSSCYTGMPGRRTPSYAPSLMK